MARYKPVRKRKATLVKARARLSRFAGHQLRRASMERYPPACLVAAPCAGLQPRARPRGLSAGAGKWVNGVQCGFRLSSCGDGCARRDGASGRPRRKGSAKFAAFNQSIRRVTRVTYAQAAFRSADRGMRFLEVFKAPIVSLQTSSKQAKIGERQENQGPSIFYLRDGLPPWLVGLAIMLAILVVYRVADIYGFSPNLPNWRSE